MDTKQYLARPYSRILIPQEGGGFSAQILEFPGCFAEGETAEETYANLEDAAASWLQGCEANGTPVPPPITNYETSGKFALRLPKSLYARVTMAAAAEGVSANQYITAAVAERLGGNAVLDALKRAVAVFRQAPACHAYAGTDDAQSASSHTLRYSSFSESKSTADSGSVN